MCIRDRSNQIQNDLIEVVSSTPLVAIKNLIKETHTVAVLVDEITDISNKTQFSIVLHYQYAYNGEVKESILGFTYVSCYRHPQVITELIHQLLIEFEFSMKN